MGTKPEAVPSLEHGFALQHMKMLLDRRSEDVGPIADIARVRLDEERLERCTACAQALVVSNEEATCKRRRQHIERAGDVCLIAEGCTMVGRYHEPVIGRQRRGLRGEVTEVVEGDADCPC